MFKTLRKFLNFTAIIMILISIIMPVFVTAVYKISGEPLEPLKGSVVGVGVDRVEGVIGILMQVTRWTYTIFFIIAVLYILFAAYTYLTAQSEPEKIKSATNQIIYAAIAIAVALLAVSINAIVGSIIKPAGGDERGGSASQTYSVTGDNSVNQSSGPGYLEKQPNQSSGF